MKRKEIVVLECGTEMRTIENGIHFTSSGRDFFVNNDEVVELIQYLTNYLNLLGNKPTITGPEYIGKNWVGEAQAAPVREMTPAEKAARVGVTAAPLMPPSAASGMKGRVVPAQSVSVHNS